VPVRTSWSADDPCGVSGWAIERSVNGAAWTRLSPGTRTATSIAQALSTGSRYRFAARATDGAGNTSGRRDGAAFVPYVRQSTSSRVRYSPGWSTVRSSAYAGGSTRVASAAGASASYTFTGTSIAWVAAVGPTRGPARVYLDGAYQRTVSLYASSPALRRIVFAHSWPGQGTHTIRVVVVGTSGHPRVDVDAFARLYRP
jgi:hypothetical protein